MPSWVWNVSILFSCLLELHRHTFPNGYLTQLFPNSVFSSCSFILILLFLPNQPGNKNRKKKKDADGNDIEGEDDDEELFWFNEGAYGDEELPEFSDDDEEEVDGKQDSA